MRVWRAFAITGWLATILAICQPFLLDLRPAEFESARAHGSIADCFIELQYTPGKDSLSWRLQIPPVNPAGAGDEVAFHLKSSESWVPELTGTVGGAFVEPWSLDYGTDAPEPVDEAFVRTLARTLTLLLTAGGGQPRIVTFEVEPPSWRASYYPSPLRHLYLWWLLPWVEGRTRSV